MGEGIESEFGVNRYTLLYLKWITNKALLYSTRNSLQCYVAAEWEGVWGRMDTSMCMGESFCNVHLKLSQYY